MTTGRRVLVSILNFNGFDEAVDAITSLRNQTYSGVTLQVLDNASTNDCVARLRQRFPEVDIVSSAVNVGYTGGNNLALIRGLAEGFDAVIVCNADIVLEPDAVGHLVEVAEASSEVGIVGGVEVDFYTGATRATGGTLFPDWRFRFDWPTRAESAETPWRGVLFVQGALVMFTRRALEAGVRFDENLFLYWDEVDLGYALLEKGLLAFSDDRVRYRHRNRPEILKDRAAYFQQRNRLYLARKHWSALRSSVYVAYSTLLELPLKASVRTLQGRPGFALACIQGHFDGLAGRMGRGRFDDFRESRQEQTG